MCHLDMGPTDHVAGEDRLETILGEGKEKLETYAMTRVVAGAHLPTPWLFESAKRPDDRANYCLDCSFLS